MRSYYYALICIGVFSFASVAYLSRVSEKSVETKDPSKPASESLSSQPESVSIIQLIASPERFDGKFVRVIGYMRLEADEVSNLYLHEDDDRFQITKNGLWLITKQATESGIAKYDRKYVLVEGIFNSKNKGHMGLSSGAIDNIKRLEVWK